MVRPAAKERLEARISPEQKRLLQEAASLRGQSLTDFVVSSVQEAARRTVEEWQVISLSRRDRDLFVRTLLEAPAPNRNLRAAAERFRRRRDRVSGLPSGSRR